MNQDLNQAVGAQSAQSRILDGLNDKQREAVVAKPGPLLVLAGAGSGKTRVLTCRAAWLVAELRVPAHAIMAVTFTNKAAREMRERIQQRLNVAAGAMMVGTFHGLAHQMLRRHPSQASLDKDFTILDQLDQLRLIKQLLLEQRVPEASIQPRQAQYFINDQKEQGLRAAQCNPAQTEQERWLGNLYQNYEKRCERAGVVDFAELLLRCCEVLERVSEVRQRYHRLLHHFLIDEFQDTNALQFRLIQLLDARNQVMAVGDDDQAIYSWRGAKVEHMLQFERMYPNAQVIRLEQNYRSTQVILDAANGLISHNSQRLGKKLWSAGEQGQNIDCFDARNEYDEAEYVISAIQQSAHAGLRWNDHAVLYRTNAQSRVIEQCLMEAAVPYRVYGGLRFFDRAEIKDVLAYLQLIRNPNNDIAMLRVVNMPPRGLGAKTVQRLREQALSSGQSLWHAAVQICAQQALAARTHASLSAFVHAVEELRAIIDPSDLSGAIEHTIEQFRLKEHYMHIESEEKGRERCENLDELINAGRDFSPVEQDQDSLMDVFLCHAALEAGETQAAAHDDAVQLMTIHMAKGLEFQTVFITGLEEELFPSQRSIDNPAQLAEERRLCYVAITRARRQLHLSYAHCRNLHGRLQYRSPSRFIGELPQKVLNFAPPSRALSNASGSLAWSPLQRARQTPTLRAGEEIHHPHFGSGMIIRTEGQGEQCNALIHFYDQGDKWISGAFLTEFLAKGRSA